MNFGRFKEPIDTKMTGKKRKRFSLNRLPFKRLFTITLLVLSASVFFTNAIIKWYSNKYVFSDSDKLIHNKVGLVLGTSKRISSGQSNSYFTYRINAAVKLFKEKKIDYILVSGDNGTKEYNEPIDMFNALLAAGVPKDHIVLDYAGFRTLDSIVRCHEVFGQESFTIISQKFHNERAVFLAHAHGINAVAYNAQDVSSQYSIKTQIREVFARSKVFIDLIFERRPKYLGDEVKIGTDQP